MPSKFFILYTVKNSSLATYTTFLGKVEPNILKILQVLFI
jgi:hypothetical protein